MIRLPIEHAAAISVQGITCLQLVSRGHRWIFDPPKSSLMQNGFMCLPPELAEFGETLILYGQTEAEQTEMENVSADPILVEMARRLWVHDYQPGEPVKIPTLQEAAEARWDIAPYAGIFRRKI